jgi:nucleoid DNA-binding protein
MKTQDLVKKLSSKMKISKAESGRIVTAFCNTIIAGVKIDGRVVIMNFGTFTRRNLSAHVRSNFLAGRTLNVPARNFPWFRASKNLNAFVNNGRGEYGKN